MALATRTATISANAKPFLKVISWLLLDGDDVGSVVETSSWQDRCVHVFGTFDSGTIVLQGSNDPLAATAPNDVGTSWVTLRDPAGNNLSFTAAGLKQILELPRYIRPSVSGGGGSCSLSCVINARGDRP